MCIRCGKWQGVVNEGRHCVFCFRDIKSEEAIQIRKIAALERIANVLEDNGRMGDAELREIMGHTDTSIMDALREQWRGDIPDEPIGVTCGICNTTREDDEAARRCAMSHV